MTRKFFVGGNFKMNGTQASLTSLLETLNNAKLNPDVDVLIAPPSIYLLPLLSQAKSGILVGAQNVHFQDSGAYTGEISPAQLKAENVNWVLTGHSERRTLFHETSELVAKKTSAAIAAGLNVILCVGETLSEREAAQTDAVVQSQLAEVVKVLGKDASKWAKVVIAYEPVWAIGTGKVATPEIAQQAHHAIRAYLSKDVSQDIAQAIRIIYGGSVSAKNCTELAAEQDIDGFLVGGASLTPGFVDIINVKK